VAKAQAKKVESKATPEERVRQLEQIVTGLSARLDRLEEERDAALARVIPPSHRRKMAGQRPFITETFKRGG
jgi:hypothetical protein